jgi:hypothetical protein
MSYCQFALPDVLFESLSVSLLGLSDFVLVESHQILDLFIVLVFYSFNIEYYKLLSFTLLGTSISLHTHYLPVFLDDHLKAVQFARHKRNILKQIG